MWLTRIRLPLAIPSLSEATTHRAGMSSSSVMSFTLSATAVLRSSSPRPATGTFWR